MRRAFTLIELLIVVTIMATLMTIVFRLGSITQDKTELINTVTRLQKLENCLSGYYAAFGSYPPVAVHGSRNIYSGVENGVQVPEKNNALRWEQIEAACRSQPLEACFPFPLSSEEMIKRHSDEFQEAAEDWPEEVAKRYGSTFTGDFVRFVRQKELWESSYWPKVQIFKFGLMSYLLPRYLVMMSGAPEFYGAGADPCAQWEDNNDACISSTDGKTMEWRTVYDNVGTGDNAKNRNRSGINEDYVTVANMPTQAVCARWIKNLEGLCTSGDDADKNTVFGVCIKDGSWDMWAYDETGPKNLQVYSPNHSGSNWYVLNTITVMDGWGNPFYYYSPNGSQSYTLWSAGPNFRTFPPWIDRAEYLDKLPTANGNNQQMSIAVAIADDIVRMHH